LHYYDVSVLFIARVRIFWLSRSIKHRALIWFEVNSAPFVFGWTCIIISVLFVRNIKILLQTKENNNFFQSLSSSSCFSGPQVSYLLLECRNILRRWLRDSSVSVLLSYWKIFQQMRSHVKVFTQSCIIHPTFTT